MINNADDTSNSDIAPTHPNDVTKKKTKHTNILETLMITKLIVINPIATDHRNKLKQW